MAIPPPHEFVHVVAARLEGLVLEVEFDHPAPAAFDPFFVEAFLDSDLAPDGRCDLRAAVLERRSRHGVPTCVGPVVRQRRSFPLDGVLPDPRATHGVLRFNLPSLYGHHAREPVVEVAYTRG